MKILSAYDTDIGISKKVNQDALCIKEAQTNIGLVTMALLCDGMGGYSSGEIASSTVIKAFSEWFENKLPCYLQNDFSLDSVRADWVEMVKLYSRVSVEYGLKLVPSIKLGTTLTGILITEHHGAEVIQVGDSRLYKITDKIEQVTNDHTKVAHLYSQNQLKLSDNPETLTEEQIDYLLEHHPERHILSQCIGGSRVDCKPDSYRLKASEYGSNTVFLLCSDGFRHEVTKAEIFEYFRPDIFEDEIQMQTQIRNAINLNMQRNETDNISAVLLKIL